MVIPLPVWIVCAFTLTFSALPGLAEDRAYEPLLERYLDGDHSGPVIELGRWGGQELDRAVEATVVEIGGQAQDPSLRDRRLMAGALLHTERAVSDIQVGLNESGASHIGMARLYVQWLESVAPQDTSRSEVSSFCRRWYRLAGAQALGVLDVGRARQLLEEGLRQFPGDAGLLLTLGSVEETLTGFGELRAQIRWDTTRGITRPLESMRRRAERQSRLEKAEALYTRALAADPTLAEARLRRGRTFQVRQRASDAENDFAWIVRENREPSILYLARLFRGRLQEERGDLSAAAESYRAATEMGRRSQAANLGLTHVLSLLGDRDGSAQALDHAVARPIGPDPLDGWWKYSLGQPLEREALIVELRKEVHR
jgi:Tetratricopeptide repeat